MDKILNIQKKIGTLSKTETNPFFKSKYFDINSLLAQLQPLLVEEGLVVIQPLTNVDGKPALRTEVWSDGQILVDNSVTLPDLQDPQKMGSAITYYRRYALQSLFLLQAEDDDANHASEKDKKVYAKGKGSVNLDEPPFVDGDSAEPIKKSFKI